MSRVSADLSTLLTSLVIRPAGIDDLVHARQLLSAAFKTQSFANYEACLAETLQAQIDSPGFVDMLRGQALTLAWLHERPVAVCGWAPGADGGKLAMLGLVGVDPLFTGLGLGRLIVSQVEDSARRAGFHELVAQTPWPLIEFHRRMGYLAATQPRRDQAGRISRRAASLGQTIMHKRLVPTEAVQPCNDRAILMASGHEGGHIRFPSRYQRPEGQLTKLVLKPVPSKTMH